MSTSDFYDGYWFETSSGYRPRANTWVSDVYERRVTKPVDCLDVGCGDGRAAGDFLSARGQTYVGVDISDRAIAKARASGLNALVIRDASDLPFKDASFDFAVCMEVFEHLFSTEETAVELWRVLRPGGTLVVSVPNVAHWRHRLELGLRGRFVARGDAETLTRPWRDPHIRFFTFDAMSRLLEHTGFRIVEQRAGGVSQAREIPFVGRFASVEPGLGSEWLWRLRPPLFGNQILTIAERPTS